MNEYNTLQSLLAENRLIPFEVRSKVKIAFIPTTLYEAKVIEYFRSKKIPFPQWVDYGIFESPRQNSSEVYPDIMKNNRQFYNYYPVVNRLLINDMKPESLRKIFGSKKPIVKIDDFKFGINRFFDILIEDTFKTKSFDIIKKAIALEEAAYFSRNQQIHYIYRGMKEFTYSDKSIGIDTILSDSGQPRTTSWGTTLLASFLFRSTEASCAFGFMASLRSVVSFGRDAQGKFKVTLGPDDEEDEVWKWGVALPIEKSLYRKGDYKIFFIPPIGTIPGLFARDFFFHTRTKFFGLDLSKKDQAIHDFSSLSRLMRTKFDYFLVDQSKSLSSVEAAILYLKYLKNAQVLVSPPGRNYELILNNQFKKLSK
jgi:hypothetical protein